MYSRGIIDLKEEQNRPPKNRKIPPRLTIAYIHAPDCVFLIYMTINPGFENSQPENLPERVSKPANRFRDLLFVDGGERGAEEHLARLLGRGGAIVLLHGCVLVRGRLGAEPRALDHHHTARDARLEDFFFNGQHVLLRRLGMDGPVDLQPKL